MYTHTSILCLVSSFSSLHVLVLFHFAKDPPPYFLLAIFPFLRLLGLCVFLRPLTPEEKGLPLEGGRSARSWPRPPRAALCPPPFGRRGGGLMIAGSRPSSQIMRYMSACDIIPAGTANVIYLLGRFI